MNNRASVHFLVAVYACLLFAAVPVLGVGEVSAFHAESQASGATSEDDNKHQEESKDESASRLSDESLPLQIEEVPQRPRLFLEFGDRFLDSGALGPEFTLPTGAVWRPSLWVFGEYRTAVQTFERGFMAGGEMPDDTRTSEWANRLDIFGNLKLSGTERILVAFRPLDRDNRFSGNLFEPEKDFEDELNAVVRTLFFEGDFGEIFPGLDEGDTRALDIGFSVGRQPLLFQEGLLISTGGLGNTDAVGLVRNNLQLPGTSNARLTALYGWDNIYRDDNRLDREAQLFGLFTETDFPFSTISVDLVYIESGDVTGDAYFAGIQGVQRFGFFNTTLAVNTSIPSDLETQQTSRGTLLSGQVSFTPPRTHNLVYLNGYWGIDQFSSAIRGPDQGGPLGRTGILFEAVGLGRFRPVLSNQADDSAGGSLGHQMFFHGGRRQLVMEVGGRKNTVTGTPLSNRGAIAAAARYQHAIGHHFIPRVDFFGEKQEDRNLSYGARLELLMKF
ncbi:MAG TPA: hypothetical protein EYN18_05860 [Nitrospirales bacterium]|nr:hypothetical protein [Nitrospirales bacterium]HIB55303.1 hypothetical protein [Nitrospirales bacterium]HIC04117.1 hypothetical protein [Nitrospirales bacterium]HIN33674.1 hypothetical protein [Nitrospirales bacterium]HIO21906.1 hypothetical protein [Nitrospirales bacterium]